MYNCKERANQKRSFHLPKTLIRRSTGFVTGEGYRRRTELGYYIKSVGTASATNLPSGDLPVYVIVSIERLRGAGPIPVGILVLDRVSDRLYLRFREDWTGVADEDTIDVVSGMGEMFRQRAMEEGPTHLVSESLDQLSNYVRLGEPHVIPPTSNLPTILDELYLEHVHLALQK